MATDPSASHSANPVLHIHTPRGLQVFPLDREVTSLGRADGNDVQIIEAHVSKRHAEIRRDGDGFVIADVGSKAGVFCNGRKINECGLQSGDRIMLGELCSTPVLFRASDVSSRSMTASWESGL